jgi:GTP1/Obg family GTP-binding protein
MQLSHSIKLFVAAIALTFSMATVAQEQQSQAQTAPQQQNIDVSDQQLKQFADAQAEIAGIQQDFSSRLQNVEDPEKARELQRQANEEMTSAVEEAGLDVESFNQIAMAIQNDPELQQKLTEMLQ